MWDYREYKVCSELAPYIDCIWFGMQVDNTEHFIIPDNTVELVFMQGTIERTKFGGRIFERLQSHLAGLKTQPQKIRISSPLMVAVRFKPGGIYPFTSVDATELIDVSAPLQVVFGKEIIDLETLVLKQLSSGVPAANLVPLIMQFFKNKLSEGRTEVIVDELLERIELTGGNLSILDFAEEVGLSMKTIERKFKQCVGLPPKKYAGMYRFHRSVLAMSSDYTKLSDIAYDLGYFDQMHFIRETKRYAHRTPREVLQLKMGLQQPTLNLR